MGNNDKNFATEQPPTTSSSMESSNGADSAELLPIVSLYGVASRKIEQVLRTNGIHLDEDCFAPTGSTLIDELVGGASDQQLHEHLTDKSTPLVGSLAAQEINQVVSTMSKAKHPQLPSENECLGKPPGPAGTNAKDWEQPEKMPAGDADEATDGVGWDDGAAFANANAAPPAIADYEW